MKKNVFLIAIIVVVFALSGCAAKQSSSREASNNIVYDYSGTDAMTAGSAPAPAATMAPAYEEAEAPKSAALADSSDTTIQQMIIKNADLTIAADDPADAMDQINDLANGMGGFVVSSYVYKSYTDTGVEVPEATITVRVPAEKLDSALGQIKALTGDADKYTVNESISGQDVTKEYTDLKSRLKNLEEADAKLSELYDKAEKTEDALAVYNQKIQITEQIEVIKGQMQYYEQSASMSAISVRIVAKETIAPITVAGWEPQGVARNAVQALINFGKGLVEFLIWLIILIVPILVIIGLPIFFIVRWQVRRNRRKQAARQEALRQAMNEQKPPEINQ
jgi:hypothetical protein